MSVNRRRGEVAAKLDGQEYRLCLTLGALAELETAFQAEDLNRLAERFSSGRLSARDMTAIIAAGLRGGGHDVCDEDVRAMQCEGGAAGFAALVGELLTVTFGGAPQEGAAENPPKP
ncbi:gene transfer agent family protein [Chelativorans sp. YIM 93263]|uniref:gene transfer agent family protein n=1 Tax=Chelativorans sp. YIM 93263 TaxID=2906648 RepID=UPI0023797469|nr:gene transfer agent family protein [Chelativorans sp. YIM 93263]